MRHVTEEIVSNSILFGVVFFLFGDGAALYFPNLTTLLLLCVALVFVAWWGISGKHRVLVLGCVSVLALVWGGYVARGAIEASEHSSLVGREISGEGVVFDDPKAGQFSQNIYLKIFSCEGDVPCTGAKVLIQGDAWQLVHFGDTIRFSCTFEQPENFSNEFDWRMYLAARGVYAVCQKADIERLDRKTFLGYLGMARRALEKSVDAAIEQPYAALGNGLLFGGSSRMSEALAQDFARVSMTHIVAVSGYNVSLIAGYAFSLAIFAGFWRRGATVIAVLSIVGFVLFIGSPSSGVRAAVMGAIVLACLMSGRSNAVLRALLYASAAMVAFSPLSLRYDTGFQLSCLATLGIVVFSPFWERFRPKREWIGGITDILFVTLSAQIFVLPVIHATFGGFSVLSVIVNLLVLPTIPLAMLLTFLAAVSGLLFEWLGFFFGIGAQAILWYDIWVIRIFARVPWGFVSFQGASAMFVTAWYAVAGFFAWWVWRRERVEARRFCKKYRDVI